MKKILLSILASSFIFCGITFAQKGNNTDKYNNPARVRACDTLIYYGADFSHVRISDGANTYKSTSISITYPPAWIAFLEKEMPAHRYVKPAMRKRNFSDKRDDIQNISIKADPNFIISPDYSFPIDTVEKAVKSYTLTDKSGVGLVLIPENFNKKQETAFTWVVFFDISNRNIIWATKTTGKCEHMGYTAHWASGVIDGFKKFVKREYR
ncbi:MAG: hypothetical protein Q8867_04885 [Bacteroidota bacterium]|nr:hypothetical protein [Bacteroidota bacterium]